MKPFSPWCRRRASIDDCSGGTTSQFGCDPKPHKLFGVAECAWLRHSQPERPGVGRLGAIRPVNGIAAALTEQWLGQPGRNERWCTRVQRWTAQEGTRMQRELARIPGITPMPSAANFLLIAGLRSLVPLREALEHNHRILLRDCRSFAGLGERWLRIGLQSARNNRRIVRALRKVQRLSC